MSRDPLARATELLQSAVAEPGDTSALPPGRADAIARLGDALRARAERTRRKRLLGALAVAAGVAAIATAGVVASSSRRGGDVASDLGRVREAAGAVTAVRDGRSEDVGTGTRVAEGTELRTPRAAEAHLDFDTGTQLTIGGASRVRLVEQSRTKRFSLEAGTLFARVAKLREGERFVVATADAEVEVRGTAFRVSVVAPDSACGGGTPTRLDVTEGTVVVRRGAVETRVTAGERWPICAETRVAEGPPSPSSSQFVDPAPPPPPSPPSLAHAGAGAAHEAHASSRLAEQNDLYEQAMRAKREGRAGASVATLERLLALYPTGPLAEGAGAERMRILAGTDRARAASAARDYLRRWPQGGARADAERLAAGAP